MLHTPIYTLCVSFLIPHHPLVSLLRCIEYSVEQHPRVLQYLHGRQDFRREKFKDAATAVSGQNRIDVRPFACFFSYFSVPTTRRVVLMLYILKCVLFSFSMYKYVVLPPLCHTFHPVPWSDICRILFSMATERYHSNAFVPHSSTLFCLPCHPAIVFVLFVVRRSFFLSFSLHIRLCSLPPLLPLFFAC